MTKPKTAHVPSTTDSALTTTRTPVSGWSLHLGGNTSQLPEAIAAALAQGLALKAPQSVLAALVAAGLAPDVATGGQESQIEWASHSTWIYRTTLPRTGDGSRVTLQLDGLDTIATVRVDGEVVAQTDNMFHSWHVDLGVDEVPGSWTIEIEFHPALPYAQARETEQPLPRADMYDLPFNQIRKMASSFGWDWGPTTNSAGLWREVYVVRTPVGRLSRVGLIGGWTADGAVLTGEIAIQGPGSTIHVEVSEAHDERVIAELVQAVDEAVATISLGVATARPWNVRSHGEQPLYDVRIELRDASGHVLDRATRRVGFRHVELVQTSDVKGQSFEIHVNGSRVWARGFNWIPADMLPERVTHAQVRTLIEGAVHTGANMLRVWGGGVVESDAFYDVCDELGVMVWQDFSFACAAYPEDSAQVARVERETADAVARIGHRTSLVLWCGSNENLWGYEDWGWKEALAPDQGWGEKLYREVIPATLATLDPHRPYIPGSPFSNTDGVHPNDQGHGPTHHWDTWNELDYVAFEDKRSRFASEFGWQAPASWPTLVRALDGEPTGPDDVGLQRLQKHPQGQAALARAVADHVPHLPQDGPGWYFATQLVQARAFRASIARFRSLHDECSGVLWWQLNDCWPALSWSVMDVSGRPKLAWFAAREVFRDRAVLPSADGDAHGLTLVNDSNAEWHARGTVRVIDAAGEVLSSEPLDLRIQAGRHVMVTPASVPAGGAAIIVDAGSDRAVRWLFGDLDLPHPAAQITVDSLSHGDDGAVVSVRAHTLVRDLALLAELHPDLEDATVNRQLLLLLPGERADFTVKAHRAQEIVASQWAQLFKSDGTVEVTVGIEGER